MDNTLERRALCTLFNNTLNSNQRLGQYCYSWQDMLKKLEAPLHNTNLTVSQFIADKKPIYIKSSNGYYIMGKCGLDSNGIPSRAANVAPPREFGLLSIDGDGVPADWDSKVHSVLGSYEYLVHATISSHRGDVRRRLIIPLAVNVDADTRAALARILCSQIGMQGIDKTCIEAKRCMCFPVILQDGDSFSYHNEGKMLDAVDWLNATGKDWHNIEALPLFENEKAIKEKIAGVTRGKILETGEWTPPADITDKWVSAFCRTYKVTDVFERYRPGYYSQVRPGRWNHAEASNCSGGIQVINNAYCYSWYATDKLSTGRIMNAFEVYCALTDQTEKKAKKEIKSDLQVQEAYRQEVLKALQIPPCAEGWADQYDVTDEGLARRCFEAFPSKRRDGAWWDYSDGVYKKVSNETMLLKVGNVARIVAALQPFSEEAGKYVGSTNKHRAVLAQWQGLADAAAPAEEDWDNQPGLLAFKDCLIDLHKFMECPDWLKRDSVQDAVVEFSPDYLITKKLSFPLDEMFKTDTKLAELNRAVETYLPNADTRNYFWKAVGSCLDGTSYADNKIIWLNGVTAGNGKSTLMSAITAALGDYAGVSKVELFYKQRNDNNGEGANPALEALRNSRLAHFAEGDKERTLNSSKLKNFTGGQKIYTRKLYEQGSEWLPKMRMVFDSNGMPAISGRDEGLFRRLRIIPFRQTLRDTVGEDDTLQRWQTDVGIHAAIIFMLLVGLGMWYADGKKVDKGVETCPPEVRQETLAYSSSFESTTEYFEDHIVVTNDDKNFVAKVDFFSDYEYYCTGKGVGKHSFFMDLAQWLETQGCKQTKRRVNGIPTAGWAGCKLAAEEDENSWLYKEGRLQKKGFQPYYERHYA